MPPKFGTSGVRGLVKELTDDLVSSYVHAFLQSCPTGGVVHVGRDLRPSSPNISEAVINAVRRTGLAAVDHGDIPTPALALASMTAGHAAIMVTGSHIPADRNGLKFYIPNGEIDKAEEQAILANLDSPHNDVALGPLQISTTALEDYVTRYVLAFGAIALRGLRIGVYEHSSVARDVLGDALRALGAETIALARSDDFIPVDTEAIDPVTREQLTSWAKTHALDAIVSTDGDGDRPMVTDNDGTIIAGDVLGPLTATFLGANSIATPISSNSMIDKMEQFVSVQRTKIGSPYVIAAMDNSIANNPTVRIAGYEPNGGFLLGYSASGPAGPIGSLMTRDSLLPIIAPLVAANTDSLSLKKMVEALPQSFTASDRVQNVPVDQSAAFIARLTSSSTARRAFFETRGTETSIDVTDGLRVTYDDGIIIHLRPSGNAPECRCYIEAGNKELAHSLLQTHLRKLATALA
jgi:phosphomannomutase